MQYGLNEIVIKKLNELFVTHPEIKEAVLYGSRAKGNYRPGSDVDLTLKGKDLNLKIMNSISNEIDDLLLPYTFDLSIYKQIENIDLIEHIARVGILFYKCPEL